MMLASPALGVGETNGTCAVSEVNGAVEAGGSRNCFPREMSEVQVHFGPAMEDVEYP